MPTIANTTSGVHTATETGKFPFRETDQRDQPEVIDEGEQNGKDKRGGFPAFARGNAKRDTDQAEQNTGKWKRETLMEFDGSLLAFRAS